MFLQGGAELRSLRARDALAYRTPRNRGRRADESGGDSAQWAPWHPPEQRAPGQGLSTNSTWINPGLSWSSPSQPSVPRG